MSLKIFILSFVILLNVSASAQKLQTVEYVDLNKYSGKWYEIAAFPQRFQEGCQRTTAEYMPDRDYIIVENRCNRDSLNGNPSCIRGKAFVQENTGNAKLKVQFFWPLKGKYWIIDLAEDYSYAVVSHPNRKYLWILSRTPEMDEEVYNKILVRLKEKGLDISKLRKTPQV